MMAAVGEVRPSQLMFSFGVGATLDLPGFSALVLGLDSWEKDLCPPVSEPRLLAAVQRVVNTPVKELRLAPVQDDGEVHPARGVPVVPFPRWMYCTQCHLMAPLEDGIFEKREDRGKPVRFVHTHCPNARNPQYPPNALPIRFLFACAAGHLSDIPWIEFVHDGHSCKDPRLYMHEYSVTGDVSDIKIVCNTCNAQKNLVELIGKLRIKEPMFRCKGLHPHLRTTSQEGCDETTHLINLGASNLWFPQSISVLSIPDTTSALTEYLRSHWEDFEDVETLDAVKYLSKPSRHPKLAAYPPEEILQAIKSDKEQAAQSVTTPDDIKLPEWEVLSGKTQIEPSPTLNVCPSDTPPTGYDRWFDCGMLVRQLSEVRAMYGFTRLNTQQELDLGIVTPQSVVPLTRLATPEWLPAFESHGEGIFLRLREDAVQQWERRDSVQKYAKAFRDAHTAWRKSRRFENPAEGFPGMRYILLHSLAHALMQQIVLDCGYTAASIRERLYCRTSEDPGGPMAGFLLYTAATDSEGTLGGLVSLGRPSTLGRYITQALENMRLCSSDPLCAERKPDADGRGIHGAACHACLFAPETSCECGNRYLDRNVLVYTFADLDADLPFFGD